MANSEEKWPKVVKVGKSGKRWEKVANSVEKLEKVVKSGKKWGKVAKGGEKLE